MSDGQAGRSGPEVSVIIPTYRRPEHLRACLEGLASQDLHHERFEVIVVDDACDPKTVEDVEAWAADRRLSVSAGPRQTARSGPAAARNEGWHRARSPIIAFIDDDCRPTPGWLRHGLEAFAATPGVGLVQGRTMAPEGVDVWGLTDWYTWQIIDGPTDRFESCNIFYRREALARCGGFDEEIPWPWGEDTELGWKVKADGWESGFAAGAAAVHPVDRRGARWYIRTGLREATLVTVATRYPEFRRRAYWRPWAYRREHPALVVAAAGVALSLKWRPALLAALPYAWWRRPSLRQPHALRLAVQTPVVDAAGILGQVRGAWRNRTVVI